MIVPPAIEHRCDVIEDADGKVEQVYNHLIYRFGDAAVVVARAYLDEPGTVAVITAGEVPANVMAYLRERFSVIRQLGIAGYATIWTA